MNKALALGLFAAILLAGCGSTKEDRLANPAPCPNIAVLPDAARQIVFDGAETAENIAWTAEVQNVSLACRYVGTDPIDASAKIVIAFGKGPKAEAASHNYAYWVAVTRVDREVIVKEEYLLPVKFSDKPVEIVEQEIKEIIIPRADDQVSGTNFEIIVGLVITPEQALFNRSGKSLKFPDL
ncbi:MAG: hypothetical protein KDA46_10735 [Parvularculaceae bacterium]|nr:hypothetical protein [Parvularculaceae bacterium]